MSVERTPVRGRPRWARLVDDALWGPESARRLTFVQRGLAVLIGLRIALGSYRQLDVLPDALFDPVPVLGWLPTMPSATVIVAVQVVGTVAAGLAAARRWPRAAYAVAWLAFLVLAGIRGSRGKVLHNDLLLLWVGACFLLAPVVPRCGATSDDRRASRAWGWPIRLGIVVTALVYGFAGFHKVRRSGLDWVFGDNMSWVMRWGPSVGSSPLPSLTEWVGDHHPAAVVSAAFIITVEVAFPLVIWHRWLRPWFAMAAVALHTGTWVLLGLDYWAWAVTVPLLLVDWPAVLDRARRSGAVRVVRSESAVPWPSVTTTASASTDPRQTKHIFVTGGVASGLGKGLTGSSLGRLLKMRGLRVVMQKLDPYINVDPGTMNPFEHGEVFVTEDGGETDLDLGHYERFVDENLSQDSNATTGSIYQSVLAAERRGDYLGRTVQVIPHITDEIKRRIRRLATDDVDIVITEVGGTVGDIEILPFLEAIRQFRNDVGRANVCYLHVTLVPFIGPTGEQKTKPTQHSVTELRSRGIQPDVIVCRSERAIPDPLKRKIADLSDVPLAGVINNSDANHLYEVPLLLHEEGLDTEVCRILGLPIDVDLTSWEALVERVDAAVRPVRIGVIGKYVSLPDAYLSVAEALRHGAFHHGVKAELEWIQAEDVEGMLADGRLRDLDGIVIPGGFGERGIEGKIAAAGYAREHEIPCLGLCLGMQVMTIEFARNVLGLAGANSSEFDRSSPHPVIDLMDTQREVVDMGGTMRLGTYPARLVPGSVVAEAYGSELVYERHRHRYEFNAKYRSRFEGTGFVCSGVSPDERLVEFIELEGHPFWVGTQAHPEFKSRPDRPAPLFRALLGAARARADGRAPRLLDVSV